MIAQSFHAIVHGPLTDGTHGATQMPVMLSYEGTDQYAVTATIGEVPWTFARELLAEGLAGHAGEGDVAVDTIGESVYLAIRSPDGGAVVEMPINKVRVFLRKTFTAVPLGHESADIDAILAQVFAS